MNPMPRLVALPLSTRKMRTIYCLISQGALDLCAAFVVEYTSFAGDSQGVQHLVETLKAGWDSRGTKQPLRVSEATLAEVREFLASGRPLDIDFTPAAVQVSVETSIPLSDAAQIIAEMGRQSHAGSRERAAADALWLPAMPAPIRGVPLPPPGRESPGDDPREHLARELERAYVLAGAPKYKDLRSRLAPLAASSGTLSGVFRGHRHPRWELMAALLTVFGARQRDIEELWLPLWVKARECIHPVGAAPPAPRLSAVAEPSPESIPPPRSLRRAPAAG
ncbi:hypothetical protein [Nonomuraea sp. NPDC049625]|uniref:hypothetical protein n=1 Tax=Nonomuraea sp. NPDC049625 TaxID=3155775 RepID=UPI003436CBA2